MALSNAERQRRYRQRRKRQLKELKAEVGEIPVVDRPKEANGSNVDQLPRRLQSLYGAIDHIHDTCWIAENIEIADVQVEAYAKHVEYMRSRLAKAERHLRGLRKKLTQT